ncbi:MAG TPA: thioredoxin family protein [Polyangiaceae bacterium]|nr:thioredoxin family protein [Polyangiaceae bacterium]
MGTPEPSSAIEATPETFDELVLGHRGELVVVEFWGPNCPNCEVFARAEPGLVAALAGEAWRFVKVNAYEHDGLARRFGLYGIPAFLLFRDGKLLGRMSQFTSREYWLAVVRERLAAGPPA